MSVVKQITGIPAPIDGNASLTVTATFEAIKTVSSDWSTGVVARVFKIQNGVTTYGDGVRLGTSRHPYALQYTFSLSAGYGITCGLDWSPSEPATTDFYDVKILAEVVKR